MRRVIVVGLIISLLSGCVVLPADYDDWDHGGRYEHRYERGWDRHHDRP